MEDERDLVLCLMWGSEFGFGPSVFATRAVVTLLQLPQLFNSDW